MHVPEARVLSTSKSLSDDCMIETRAFPVQLMLAAQKEKTSALKRKTVQIIFTYDTSPLITPVGVPTLNITGILLSARYFIRI